MLAIGAAGVISVVANLVPRDVIALVDAFRHGDLSEARRLHARLFPLCRALLGVATNPSPVKLALSLLGRGNGELRMPLCPPDEHGLETLRHALVHYGLPVSDGSGSLARP